MTNCIKKCRQCWAEIKEEHEKALKEARNEAIKEFAEEIKTGYKYGDIREGNFYNFMKNVINKLKI